MLNLNFKTVKSIKLSLTMMVLLAISGCQTLDTAKHWPDDVPKRSIFVKAYLEKRNVKSVEQKVLDQHLIWIIRFYQGTVIYPNGWNRASKTLLASIDDKKTKKRVDRKIRALGIKIVNEWSQENQYRNINSSNIATWGSALRTSAERNDQENYIDTLNKDVHRLISRELSPSDISYERYYPVEDFDDF